MTRTLDRWVDIEQASDYTLRREFEMIVADLAYDLKVCGPGYPSPRYKDVQNIAREQANREARHR